MDILKVIAHQFRTPMQTINNILAMLFDEDLNASAYKKLEIIEECNNQLSDVLDNIIQLTGSFPNINGDDGCTNREFVLDKLMKKCIYSKASNPNKNSIILTNKTPVALNLYGNEKLLRELINLTLSNICSYTNNGMIEVIMEVVKKNDNTIHLKFSFLDSNKGIDLNKKKDIFSSSPFELSKADAHLNLNALILKNNISKCGGKLITDINKPFEVLSYEIKYNLSLDKTNSCNQRKKILVVEDSKMNQLLLKKLVLKLEHCCLTASNGLEAIEKCKSSKFDVVLMDLMMPVMDGFEATLKIKKDYPNIKIIAVSAIADITSKKKLNDYGFDYSIKKPFQESELINALNYLSN